MVNEEEITLTFSGSQFCAKGILLKANYDGFSCMLDNLLQLAWFDVDFASIALPYNGCFVVMVRLASALTVRNADGSFTVFAPSEEAWSALRSTLLRYF